MGEVRIIGLDLAKNVFQAHGAGSDRSVVFRRKLTRAQLLTFMAAQPPCVVVMEACASASLGPDDRRPWPRGAADPARLCEAVREAPEERHGRCRGDFRGGVAANHAVCRREERGPAGGGDGLSDPRSSGSPTDPDDHCFARALGRAGHRGPHRSGASQPLSTAMTACCQQQCATWRDCCWTRSPSWPGRPRALTPIRAGA